MMPQAAWIAIIHDGSAAAAAELVAVVSGRLLAASAMIPPASA